MGKSPGSFSDYPFIETIEQTLRVVAAAFENSLTENQKTKLAKKARLVAQKTTAGKIDSDVATKLFAACYPLHPVTLLVLITLCQKFAQNERTLFTYLGSLEHTAYVIRSIISTRDSGCIQTWFTTISSKTSLQFCLTH